MIIVEDLHKAFIRESGSGMTNWRHKLPWHKAGASALVQAVNGISLQAQDGCITGLLGANGAGKTTTLKMIASLLKADQGQIQIDGIAVSTHSNATQAHIGILSDARGLYPRLTARENIEYYGHLHGMSAAAASARASQLADWLDMNHIMERRTDGFSQGEKMKTALARALVHNPKNIILDEPTNGLDVVATRALREFLRWLRSPEGGSKCIIFSTHIMQEVERLCDTVVVIAGGRRITEGTVAELMQQAGQDNFEDAFVQLAFLSKQGESKEAL